RQWVSDFKDPAHLIDPSLALPDGRRVPVCVVLAKLVRPESAPFSFPAGPIGGGYPVFSEYQQVQRVATLGCLVKDDETAVHGLTSLRVVWPAGRQVKTPLEGTICPIGISDVRHVGVLPFSAVYPGLSEAQTDLALDAGLVRLNSLREVTSQILGVGELGAVSISRSSRHS